MVNFKGLQIFLQKPGSKVNAKVLVISEEDEEMWNSDEFSSDEEDVKTKDEHLGKGSLHRIIYKGSRGNSLTEEEVMQIQLQRQSRTVNFGVGKRKEKAFHFK